jgi:NAD(P)-dependent dehydrogenase (short-subunit alcohol dehydrogenase family)
MTRTATRRHTDTTFTRIGFGAAQAFIDAGAKVVVISSNQGRVDDAVKRLASPNTSGAVGNVREEEAFIEILKGLAPVDHVVFSGVDKIIRGKLEDLSLDDAKFLFGVKFWGAVTIGKGVLNACIIAQITEALQRSRNTTSSIQEDL